MYTCDHPSAYKRHGKCKKKKNKTHSKASNSPKEQLVHVRNVNSITKKVSVEADY